MNPRIGLWVSLLAIAACDVDVEDDSLLIERDSGKQQEDTRAEESTLVADSGPYGPTNSWWHADTVDVPPSLSGTGYGYGDTAFDFTLIDQHGDPVQLYQFYGQVIVLELFAEWCYACQGLTETGQALWEQHSDDDFVFISVMVDNGTNKPPSHQDVNTWASRFDLTSGPGGHRRSAAQLHPDRLPHHGGHRPRHDHPRARHVAGG